MNPTLSILAFLALTLIFQSCSMNKDTQTEAFKYPPTAKGETVDNYFGTEVKDPYRWLEDDTSKATGDWVTAQNEVTFNYLDKIPYRKSVKQRIEDMMNYERLGAPFKEGE